MGLSKLLNTLAIALLVTSVGTAEEKVDGKAAFAQLKALEGTWESRRPDGKIARSVFELTAGGTVLLERYSNEAMPGDGRMATAYHLDGNELVLTHYCIANNQPVLRADRFDAAAKEIQFEFLRAGNLPSPSAGHMRRAKYRMLDADRFVTEWEFFENGQKKMTETETFSRVRK